MNGAYPESWRKYIHKQYSRRGVNGVLGDYVDNVEIKEGYVTTRSGRNIKADLVVRLSRRTSLMNGYNKPCNI
jgi:NADPH-dependent 2,4-dienoyl-CoA reductase/sulfur reductase-like enzyme